MKKKYRIKKSLRKIVKKLNSKKEQNPWNNLVKLLTCQILILLKISLC